MPWTLKCFFPCISASLIFCLYHYILIDLVIFPVLYEEYTNFEATRCEIYFIPVLFFFFWHESKPCHYFVLNTLNVFGLSE
jgi:hypothetical protein